MHTFELIIGLLALIAVLAWLADRIGIPYPMLMLLGGAIFAVIPWTPIIELDPELTLVLFLPPILFQAAYTTSLRDFRKEFRQISRLAFGLVFITTILVAVVAKWIIPDLPWGAAFVLGAIVSPPDAVAATSIIGGIGAPRRVETVLEGESLINDASALVAYRFAVAAVVSGSFSVFSASVEIVIVTLGGLAIGLAVAWLLIKLFPYVEDPVIEILLTLLAPAATYLLAEEFGVSGVLSTVSCGLYLGWMTPRVQTAGTRIRSRAIWDLTVQVVNGMVFILMGITIGQFRPELTAAGLERILIQSAAVLLAMIAARFIWVFVELEIYQLSRRRLHRRANWRESIFISWTGLRGVVSLATALALPLTMANGDPFPHRTTIILITSIVIVVTLVGFGLPLPWLMRKLRLVDDGSVEHEYDIAKRAAMAAISRRLDLVRIENPVLYHQMEPFFFRVKAIADHSRTTSGEADEALVDDMVEPGARLRDEMIGSAREAVLLLRDNGTIGDEARRRVERTLDLEELRFNS